MVSKAQTCLLKSSFTEPEQQELWGTGPIDDTEAYEIAQGMLTETAQRRRQKKYAALRSNEVKRDISAYLAKAGDTRGNRKRAVEAILVRDLRDDSGMVSIEAMAQGIEATAQARLADLAEKIRPRRLGYARQTRLMGDLSDELHGTATSNAEARAFAQGVADLMEDLRTRFNRAGGAVKYRADWGLPHSHNATKMARVNVQDYIRDVMPLLDRNKHQNDRGQLLRDREIAELLGIGESTSRSQLAKARRMLQQRMGTHAVHHHAGQASDR